MAGVVPEAERRRLTAAADYRPPNPGRHAGFAGAVRALAHFLDVPMAAVALVDNCRLRLEAAVGIDRRHLPRSWALMPTLLDSDRAIVIAHAVVQPAFSHHPLRVGAWAAAPLRTPSGEVIGAVFGADHRPRQFTSSQVAILEAVAGLVMAELTARRQYVQSEPAVRHFEWLMRDASDTVVVLDADGDVIWRSPGLDRLLGLLGQGDIRPVDVPSLLHEDDMPLVAGSVTVAMARPGITGPVEFRMAHGDGSWRTMEAVFTNCFDSPQVGGVVVYLRDVTERRRYADVLAAEAGVLTAIARRAPLGEVLRGIGKMVEEHAPGCTLVIDADRAGPEALSVSRPQGRPTTPAEQQVLDVASSLVALAYERQAAAHEWSAALLAGAADADRQAGIVSRAEVVQQLGPVLGRAGAKGDKVAVLVIDLDRFKEVNERLGHEGGDQVLPMVTTRIRDVVRPMDMVARVGGDEYVVVCEGLIGELEAIGLCERINVALAEPLLVGRAEIRITASIGIAMTHGEDDHPEALLRDADAALYTAKQRGRARFEVFNESRRREARARRDLDSELERALESGELRVWLQPEIELATGNLIGFEALVRWQHPERGLLAPGEFIPQAERSGLIDRVGGWVLQEACHYGRQWRDEHPGHPFVVAVNLSVRQLGEAGLIARVAAALEESGLPADALCLELTESALMDDADLSLSVLRALKRLGVRLAIDDFGTGYSSLAYLRRFPIDAVKIDRSFVSGLGSRAEDDAIVTAVLGLTSALGLTCIAEGVEQPTQRDELIRLGCGAAQGFLFSPPRPAHEILLSASPL
ncbi:MAG: hypothetical protein QOI20_1623 [Acidimicrobiaceae bacterium]|nr:hypothetical protein [Acidimicrobiaceae bacterium]